MRRIIQCFDKHGSCHLVGKYVLVGHFWHPYVGQGVDVMELIGEVEEQTVSNRR
jgi:hypothetical protein